MAAEKRGRVHDVAVSLDDFALAGRVLASIRDIFTSIPCIHLTAELSTRYLPTCLIKSSTLIFASAVQCFTQTWSTESLAVMLGHVSWAKIETRQYSYCLTSHDDVSNVSFSAQLKISGVWRMTCSNLHSRDAVVEAIQFCYIAWACVHYSDVLFLLAVPPDDLADWFKASDPRASCSRDTGNK